MKRMTLFVALVLLCLPAVVFAAPPRLAVGDFSVTSDDPRLKYVGKGLAEMVAAEIASSRDVVLVDRGRRAELLGELEFSMSDAADQSALLKMGELLSADMILFGEVIDMGTAVLVSCSLVRVETGVVLWADKSLGPLSDYNGISRKLASSALKGLGSKRLASSTATGKKPEVSSEKNEEALIAFSDAVQAMDRKDKDLARKRIREAQAIDPGNAAVVYLASILASGSPRLLVELDKYAPTYNPALVGSLERGSVYAWSSSASLVGADVGGHNIIDLSTTSGGLLSFKEQGVSNRLGLLQPLGRRFGLSAELSYSFKNCFFGNTGGAVVDGSLKNQINTDQTIEGVSVGIGYALTPAWNIGLSGCVEYLEKNIMGEEVGSWYDLHPEAQGFHFGMTAGAAYHGPGGRFSGDGLVVWSNQAEFYVLSPVDGINAVTPGELIEGSVPLIASLGGSYGIMDNVFMPNVRLIAEIGTDERRYLAGRIQPGVEWRPSRWLSLRSAYEYVFVEAKEGSIDGGAASADGHGVMGGGSVSVGKFEITFNAIYRYRPFRLLPGSGHQDFTFMMGLAWNGLGRRK